MFNGVFKKMQTEFTSPINYFLDMGDDFINFNFTENENEINLFFDKKTYNLIGWQTVDIYQNVSITYLSYIKRNQKINKEIFKLPQQN